MKQISPVNKVIGDEPRQNYLIVNSLETGNIEWTHKFNTITVGVK